MSQPTTFPNYDTVKLTISPAGLAAANTTVNNLIEDIVKQLTTIMSTMSDLKLSWTGGSASVASEFSDQWSAAMTALFGTKKDPTSGVLVALAAGLGSAADNYNMAEQTISGWFTAFNAAISSTAPSTGAPANVTDQVNGLFHTTSVNETGY